MWTTKQLFDILENHEVETAALERQLIALSEALDSDLEEIRHRVYPGAVSYDRDRIQTTPTPADTRLVAVVQACDERREQYKRDVAVILGRIRQIRTVYSTIQESLGGLDKAVLLNLYYPRRSAEAVAGMMGTSSKTVNRRRDAAVEALKTILLKKFFKNDR